jgi:hypothetical protein
MSRFRVLKGRRRPRGHVRWLCHDEYSLLIPIEKPEQPVCSILMVDVVDALDGSSDVSSTLFVFIDNSAFNPRIIS